MNTNSPSPASSLRDEPGARSRTPLDLFGSITTLVEKVISQRDLEEFGNVPVIFIPGDDEDFFDEHQVSIQYNGGLLPDIILLTQCYTILRTKQHYQVLVMAKLAIYVVGHVNLTASPQPGLKALKKNQNAPIHRPSELPSVRGKKMSKRLGGIRSASMRLRGFCLFDLGQIRRVWQIQIP